MGKRRSSKRAGLTDRVSRALLAAAKILAFDPRNLVELEDAVTGKPVRRNPIHLHATTGDRRLQVVSERFHGTADEVAILDDDQRQPPPRQVVVIGEEKAVVYQPDRRSRRGGIQWEHETGDRGEGQPRARGRRYLVTDGKRVWSVPGSAAPTFDPDRGIVG